MKAKTIYVVIHEFGRYHTVRVHWGKHPLREGYARQHHHFGSCGKKCEQGIHAHEHSMPGLNGLGPDLVRKKLPDEKVYYIDRDSESYKAHVQKRIAKLWSR